MKLTLKNTTPSYNQMVPILKAIRTITGLGLQDAKDIWEALSDGTIITITPLENLSEGILDEQIRVLSHHGIVVASDAIQVTVNLLKAHTQLLIEQGEYTLSKILLDALVQVEQVEQ